MTVVLGFAAACFVVACGVNDGGALVALSLRVPVLRPLSAIVVLAGLVALAPIVVGTRVASTLVHGLVDFSGSERKLSVLTAIVASIAVVAILVRLRVPTSLTLATIGALVGSGSAFGLAVSWTHVALVLAAGVLGPVVGAAVSRIVLATLRPVSARHGGRRLVRALHVLGFGSECLAYGANDGQRMLAILALSAVAAPQVKIVGWQLASMSLLFAAGAVVGMYRYSGTLGSDLVPSRPHDAAVAELGGAGASFAGVLVGAPLSLTQAITGGVVGASTTRGWRRVRWPRAGGVMAAWIFTLPAAVVVGGLLGLTVHWFA